MRSADAVTAAVVPSPPGTGRALARSPSRGARRAAEAGALTIEYVVLMPALFSLLFFGIQVALFYQARSVAIAAAAEGARAAGAEDALAGSGVAAAADFIAAAGGRDVLREASVTASRTATVAAVTVTGTSMSIIPGWSPSIVQSASVPVERRTG